MGHKQLPAHVVLAALLTAACRQADPVVGGSATESEGNTGDSGSDTGSGLPGTDYFPLREGASWTYRHISPDGVTWDEVSTMSAVTFEGAPAFEMVDEAGMDGERSTSTIAQQGSKVLRVHKDVRLGDTLLSATDYDPGFLRFDNGWSEGEQTIWMYDRTEHDGEGATIDASVRYQVFTVESVDVAIEVPAGAFNCVQFLRERADTDEAARFWFADGVGKVREESPKTGAIEELAEYSVP